MYLLMKMIWMLLIKRINIKLRDNEYTFLNILDEYNIPIKIYYEYLCGIDEYKLKNVWNCIIIQWIQINNQMKKRNKKKYLNSSYYNQIYKHNHIIISPEELNNLLNEFIDNDIFKALFVVICLQNTFHI